MGLFGFSKPNSIPIGIIDNHFVPFSFFFFFDLAFQPISGIRDNVLFSSVYTSS
jgi:hypothetical protein